MLEYAERSQDYAGKQYSSSYELVKEKEKIDPKNPPLFEITIRISSNSLAEGHFLFHFSFDRGYYEDNEVERPCVLRFNRESGFINFELKQPNSVFEKIEDKLSQQFAGLTYRQNEGVYPYALSSMLTGPDLKASTDKQDTGEIYEKFSKETLLSKAPTQIGGYSVSVAKRGFNLVEIFEELDLPHELLLQLEQNYLTYESLQPRSFDYERIAKNIYLEVHPKSALEEAVQRRTTSYLQNHTIV